MPGLREERFGETPLFLLWFSSEQRWLFVSRYVLRAAWHVCVTSRAAHVTYVTSHNWSQTLFLDTACGELATRREGCDRTTVAEALICEAAKRFSTVPRLGRQTQGSRRSDRAERSKGPDPPSRSTPVGQRCRSARSP